MRAIFFVVFFAAFAASASASSDLKCDGCKWFTSKIQSYLENDAKLTNFTENLINTDVCARFPADVASKCNALVAAYVPQAITAFETKFLDPNLICTEVTKLCPATTWLAWLNCDSDSWSTMNCLQQAAHARIFNTFTVRGSVLL